MPGAPLIGKVATPDFNILGAILGGPRYMSSYLASKDAAAQQQQQMGMNADYAQQLIKRPDFQGAFQPRDQPYVNLWASMQGGTPQVGALGNSLMESGIQQGLGKDAALFNQKLTQENARYAQTIEHENVQNSADVQLQTAQKLAQQQADFKASQLQQLASPQTPQVLKDVIAKGIGLDMPAGTSISVMPDGNIGPYIPHMNGPAYDKIVTDTRAMMDQMQPVQELQTGVQNLIDMAGKGTGSAGAWEAQSGMLEYSFAKLVGAGAMQEADVAQIKKMIPGRWDNVNTSGNTDIVMEKLKQTMRTMQGKQQQIEQKWQIPANSIPNASFVARPPPPAESPLTLARKAFIGKEKDDRVSRSYDRPVTVQEQVAKPRGSIWGDSTRKAMTQGAR